MLNNTLLVRAYGAWTRMEDVRRRRRRHLNYTYGDQWGDTVVDRNGRRVTEGQLIALNGRKPLTNNLIRRMVKTVVGRWRAQAVQDGLYEGHAERDRYTASNQLSELDARAMEEFLISGCAVQRLGLSWRGSGGHRPRVTVENVCPDDFLVNHYRDPLGRDISLVGMAHRWEPGEVVRRLCGSGSGGARLLGRVRHAVARVVSRGADPASAAGASPMEAVDAEGRVTVLEVWRLVTVREWMVHDQATATVVAAPAGADPGQDGWPGGLRGVVRQVRRWRYALMLTDGTVLAAGDSPYGHGSHPFAVSMYPLTDGEVHPFVEDALDQQRYINRLIVSIDHTMQTSAKGCLLFPVSQLAGGMTLEEVARRWSTCDGIIPISGMAAEMPRQVVSEARETAATQLLQLQMQLFQQVSGVNDALMGRATSGAGGSALYEAQLRASTVALEDVFATFRAWTAARWRKADALVSAHKGR